MNIRLDLDKQDLFTIAVLSVVFFSLATWNLGMTQTPVTAAQFSSGQGFIIDLGSVNDVKSVGLLVKDGSFNLSVSTGSPDNWQVIASNIRYPYNQAQQSWSIDYYKWYEVNVQQTTRYVKFVFNQASPSSPKAVITELSVISTGDQQVSVASVNSVDAGNQNLSTLIDEQSLVQYPSTYMTQTYFDEIYYVRSAEQYLNLQVPYEWTHPPLGKLIIASGISFFGFSPFGWRILGVVAATLMIPLIYILGKKLFGKWIGALASAFLLAFDFMHFTLARMATVDTYVVLFSLASQLFFLIYLKNAQKNGWKTSVKPLFMAILFFALGFSTKWFVLYGFAAQLTFLAALRLKEVSKLKNGLLDKLYVFTDPPFSKIVGFLLLAVLVYFLTYIPDVLAGRSVIDLLSLQGAMYNYHATLNATHAFASSWWTWPLMLRPLWLYVSTLPNNVTSTITLMGNPLVWWVGFACLISISIFAIDKILKAAGNRLGKISLPALFIITFFFFQWVPYMLISRITFIYHFYLNVPFLCLATAYFISKYWSSRWVKLAAIAYFAATVALFALFYPVISGTPAANSWIDSLQWLNGWVF
ncbi:MAG: glycosyltransferase family 39 protein [Candidatus Bathyarchaeia archaeon]|nr:glycosyltransferase family 39 protein [Candidatus Bathyarchaeia archaeon]